MALPEREIDLPRSQYRHVPDGPLGKPGPLFAGLLVSLALSALCAWAAHEIGTLWAAFLPIPVAIFVGIAIAGLWPATWFRETPNDDI